MKDIVQNIYSRWRTNSRGLTVTTIAYMSGITLVGVDNRRIILSQHDGRRTHRWKPLGHEAN